jgi:hypothetical protein
MVGTKINRKESAAIFNSLSAGVVPRIGLRHIAVGREKEIKAFLQDMETIQDGGAAFRLICGEYGSGKSFMLQLVRNNAMEQNFVVIDADLTPERRLSGTNNQGLATYRELMQKISTKLRPDKGALEAILQKWIATIKSKIAREKSLSPDSPELTNEVSAKITETLHDLTEMVYGFEFAKVVECYWVGSRTENPELMQSALCWLRGEFNTKTDAKKQLPVDSIISDNSWYEFLKLFALFVKRVGYKGLIVFLDEGINLYKISNKLSRENNYEKLLSIFNDTMQGNASYLGFYISGTPQFVYDGKRGLFSYEALRSRLADHKFQMEGFVDYNAPVIKLAQLTKEETYLLLERLCEVHGAYFNYQCKLGKDELQLFLERAFKRVGAETQITPREITRDFLGLLNILQQNPDKTFDSVIELVGKEPYDKTSESEEKDNNATSNEAIEELFSAIEIS